MTIVYRDEQGFDLTPDQVDENFRHIVELYDALVASPPTAVGISNITVNGSQFTIWLSDATSFGPFTMPVAAFHWRDEWHNDTTYLINDLVTNESNVYLALQNVTYGAFDEFDAALENSDEPVWHLLWGAQERQYSIVRSTAGGSIVLAGSIDAGSYFRCLTGTTVTVWNTWVINDEVHFYQAGDDPVVIDVPGSYSGFTFSPVDGFLYQTGGRGRVITLKYVGDFTFDLFGGLAVDPSW